MDDATAKVLARLDRMGATYHAAEGWPGWYEARWPDEDERAATHDGHVRTLQTIPSAISRRRSLRELVPALIVDGGRKSCPPQARRSG